MSNTRALVSCTILSLQDSCFLYPCCKSCLSRLNQESKRASCGRCGFTYNLQNVDYRYRLSFKVSRNQDIFGVTVFGACLNPFFGITAGGLQRFIELEKSDGTYTIQQLLVKAVEDCFIGRCFIFGLKLPHNNGKTSLSGQLVACQIVSPCESLMGCTVITYFKNLRQTNSCHSESARDVCLSQQKNSQSSQRDESNNFDYTPPSCAKLDSQPSSDGFTISNAWELPGICFPLEELNSDLLQQSRVCEHNTLSQKKEGTRTCRCTCQSSTIHDDKLKDETQNSKRKSFSSSCDMFESSSHFNSSIACDTTNPSYSCKNNCFRGPIFEDKYEAPFYEKSVYGQSDQNIGFELENAPLSESLQDFVTTEPQISEIFETKECSSGKRDQMIQEPNRCFLDENSVFAETTQVPLCGKKLTTPVCNLNNMNSKENNENHCRENLETMMKNAEKIPTVLCPIRSSGIKKKMPFSPSNNMLSFSNKKELDLKRKKITSRPSGTFCSVNHEKSKCFRHCAQSEVHSVNCKAKQELTVFDDHGDKYNCSIDLFASGQSGMDMNLSYVTEISKVNEPRNVNTLEHRVSGPLLFSPSLQSTPVSYFQRSSGLKTRRSRICVDSLCSRDIKCEFKSKITHLRFNELATDGSTESFSRECDMQDATCNLSVNEWSRDLFENSF